MDSTRSEICFEEQKEQVARYAVSQLQPGVALSLGSGSTAEAFIRELARWPHASQLRLCATSKASEQLARSLNLKVEPLSQFSQLELAVDGADAVDSSLQLLKGFGGALAREKIAARMARKLWILVDESKSCKQLPLSRVPCEILPSALSYLTEQFQIEGIASTLRWHESAPYVTDNGGWILELDLRHYQKTLEQVDSWLKGISGIIEHGLFLHFPVRLIRPSDCS